jgi:hypothetical protein
VPRPWPSQIPCPVTLRVFGANSHAVVPGITRISIVSFRLVARPIEISQELTLKMLPWPGPVLRTALLKLAGPPFLVLRHSHEHRRNWRRPLPASNTDGAALPSCFMASKQAQDSALLSSPARFPKPKAPPTYITAPIAHDTSLSFVRTSQAFRVTVCSHPSPVTRLISLFSTLSHGALLTS